MSLTLSQRKALAQAKRWSSAVPKARSQCDKRRAARRVLDCLRVLLTGRAPTELERE